VLSILRLAWAAPFFLRLGLETEESKRFETDTGQCSAEVDHPPPLLRLCAAPPAESGGSGAPTNQDQGRSSKGAWGGARGSSLRTCEEELGGALRELVVTWRGARLHPIHHACTTSSTLPSSPAAESSPWYLPVTLLPQLDDTVRGRTPPATSGGPSADSRFGMRPPHLEDASRPLLPRQNLAADEEWASQTSGWLILTGVSDFVGSACQWQL
jgi:hypothetical protein